jgi:hypothetical protein
MTLCDGCESHNRATRSIQIETAPGSGHAVRRTTCEACYVALGQPETIASICQDSGAIGSGARRANAHAWTVRYLTPGTSRRSQRRDE